MPAVRCAASRFDSRSDHLNRMAKMIIRWSCCRGNAESEAAFSAIVAMDANAILLAGSYVEQLRAGKLPIKRSQSCERCQRVTSVDIHISTSFGYRHNHLS